MSIPVIFKHYATIITSVKPDEPAPMTDEMVLAMEILPLISKVQSNPNIDSHRALMNYILKHKEICELEMFKNYMNEFDDAVSYIGMYGKYWKNNNDDYHRTTRDANGKTKPARIDRDGMLHWYKNGKQHMTDKDEKGLTYPAYIGNLGAAWFADGKRHRAELGNDASDVENFGKAMPARIQNEKPDEYYYKGDKIVREKLTAKIIKKSDVKNARITLKDGSTLELHDIISFTRF